MLPVNLKIKNFYSHRYSEVDFSEFNSCLLIGNTEGDYDKSNGSGKSAIFESILWCLFNRSRSSAMDDIVTWGECDCCVEFEFVHDNLSYKVKRERSRMTSTSSVELYKYSEDKWENISCSTSGDTGKKIQEIISLDYKTFTSSIYFRQSDISEFAESDPSRKKEVLKTIIDISKWDDYERDAKSELKELHESIRLIKLKLDLYDSTVEELVSLDSKIYDEKNSLKLLSSERDSVDSNIEKLNKKYIMIKSNLDTDMYDQVIDKIKDAKIAVKDKSLRLDSCSLSINKYEKAIEGIVLNINSELKDIEDVIFVDDAEKILICLNEKLLEEKSSYSALAEHISSLENILISKDTCYSCGQDISEDLYRLLFEEHNKKLLEYSNKSKAVSKELLKLDKKIKAACSDILSNKNIDSAKLKIKAASLELDISREHLSNLISEKTNIISVINKLNNDLKLNNDVLNSLKDDNFAKLRGSRNSMLKKKVALIDSIAESNKNIGIFSEKISSCNIEIEKMDKEKIRLDLLLEDAQALEKLCKMFGKSGIQAILLDAVIDDLEETSNVLLSFISNEPTFIILDTQRIGSDGSSIVETLDLKVRMNGVTQNFKSLSGGEQFRISLALRIALSEIASRHGGGELEFLLLDEINSPLDRYGISNLFMNVITSLESKYKILIITHDDSLKEKFDNVIDVTKINGESFVGFMAI